MMFSFMVKSRYKLADGRIRMDLCPIKIQFFSPDQACFETQLNDLFKEALEDLQAVPGTDFTQ